ncbi:MAG TPA: hypothetical protein VHO46_10330 [Bacteroidales bacterium]|nr:hypothetical protein [Bacteroidales bacterium]
MLSQISIIRLFVYKAILFIAFVCISIVISGQVTGDYQSFRDGTWSDRTDWRRWDGNSWETPTAAQGYPGSSSVPGTVTILNTHDMVLNATPANAIGNLIVGQGASGTLVMGSNSTSRTLTINGNLTISTNASITVSNNTATHLLYISGNLIVNGTLDLQYDNNSLCSTVFEGTSQIISGGGIADFYSITSNSGLLSLARNINIYNGNITVNNGTFDLGVYTANRSAATGTLTLNAGTTMRIAGTNSLPVNYTYSFNNTSTVEYYGTYQNITPATYGNLVISGSGNKTSSSEVFTVTNNLSVSSGTLVLQATNADYLVGNNLTVSSGATLYHNVEWGTRLLSVGGNLSIAGNYDYSGVPRAHIQMNGTGSKTINTGSTELSILTLMNGDYSATGPVTVNDNFWAMFGTTGSFSTNGQTINANASLLINGGTVNINGGILNVTGGLSAGTGGLTGNVNMTSGTLNTDNILISPSCSFLCTGSPQINISGNFTNNGTFTGGSSNITLTGISDQNIDGFSTAGTLSVVKTGGTAKLLGNVSGSGLTVNGAGGSLNLGNGLTNTFSGAFNFSNGSINGGSSTLRLGGTSTVTGGSFTAGTGTVEFYGGAQTVPAFAYNNLTISGGNSKTLGANTRISGNLSLTSGILDLGGHDLTLGPGSGISGSFSATSMINTGNNIVIKEGNQNTDFIINLPIGNGSAYTPVSIANFTATAIAPSSWISVRSSAAPAPGIPGTHPLNRHWITSCSGITGSVLADISFMYLPSDIPSGGTSELYEIYYRPTAGEWGKPGGASAAGSNPLRATAATTLNATWSGTEPEKRTFFSFRSGSWDVASTWTLDPSGTQWLNPDSYTPSNSPTFENDEVIVLSGHMVTIASNGKRNKNLTVNGTLDFGITTGHSFETISGTGRIRLANDNFPSGDAANFITQDQGEGMVEYYGNTRNLNISRTFYNLEVNLTPGNSLIILADYIINGNLTISNGSFSISAPNPLNITVYGNLSIESSGKIVTGSANSRHQLNLYGDFTNNGEASFTNRLGPDYVNEASNGIVDVNFLNDTRNQSIICNGLTRFYRIEIDKGEDFTYVLNIDATNPDYFKLLGFANESHGSIPQLTENNNALGLVKGSVRIGNSIILPVLSEANVYSISENAQLWIDRGTVLKNGNGTLAIYGKLKISNGLVEVKTAGGITFRENGILNVEGGTLNTNQLRSFETGTSNYGGYVQTAGNVNILGGPVNNDYYVFSLPYPESVFNMSGGTLTVNTATGAGGILINSNPENIKVSGGAVIAETKSTDDFRITSTAAFWDLTFKNSTSATGLFTLGPANDIGPANIDIPAQPLKILNDFRIWGKESGGVSYPVISFSPGTNDIYIGGSFFIEDGARYIPVSGGNPPYDAIANQPTSKNTTYFNKTGGTSPVEELYQGDISNPLEFGNIIIDRTNGYEVKLTSASSRVNESVILDINGSASVLSGILNQNLFTIRTWGAIVNNDRMGTWLPGVTPSRAQIQLVENPSLTLSTTSNAVFGNVQVNVTPPSLLSLSSDVYIERMEYVKGLIYLKNFNLKIDNLWNMAAGMFQNIPATSYLKVLNNGYSGNSMIFTDGKAGDGGLTLKISSDSQAENENNILNNFGPVTFPLGFSPDNGVTQYFRPAQVVVKNLTMPGYITIRPVMGALQTTNQSGNQVLQHYWRVTHSGFASLPTVAYRFYYRRQTGISNVDLSELTNETNYVPGKVLDEAPYTRQSESNTDIFRALIETNSRAITINGSSINALFSPAVTGVTLENANYTAGTTNRFTGSVLIYYSRDYEQEARWNDRLSWTRSDILNPLYQPHDSRQPAAPAVPGAGDVAVIGWVPWTDSKVDLRGQPHGMWITDTRSIAEVVFTKMTDNAGNPVSRVYRSNFQFRPTLTINGRDGDNGILTAKLVKGEGLFWNRGSDPDYSLMDIGDFARQDSSYVIYENFTTNRVINNTPALFPNLYISNDNWGANDHNFTFARDIATTGNVELLGNVNLLLPNGTTGNMTIGRDLVMFVNQGSGSGAEIGYANSGSPRRIIVNGDLIMANTASIINVRTPNTTAPLVDHELHIKGNIIQGSTSYASTGLRLWTGANQDRITLFLEGDNSMNYYLINGSTPVLYRLVINKGNSIATSVTFNSGFSLNGPTYGSGVPKALELQNGLFIVNNSSVNLNLTTGNDHFSIPSTAGLEIRQGNLITSGNSGISLDGLLRLSGGNLNMSSGDNPIEYSASGNAMIEVSAGTLNVGGQIRRSPTSDVGILHYKQTSGTVIAGSNSATVNNRGVFEILNPGSSFSMTGGDLYIARSQASPSIASFYFDPSNCNIDVAANIHIGHSTTPEAQTIGVFAGKPLPKLRINNTSSNSPIARLEIVPATITNLLQIDAGTSFNANGLNLILNGDLSVSGTFIPAGNTTFFSGNSPQTISGSGASVNFYNLDKTSSVDLALSSGNTPLLVSNAIYLRNGTFSDNGNTITLKGNIFNDAVHLNNGTGDGIAMNGNVAQLLTGNGVFGKLTINNPGGVNIPVGNQLTITRSLKMQAGVLNIGRNLLDLGVDAVIEEASPFSTSNMIETNISFTDNGLRKTFKSGGPLVFTFPMGSNYKYTPVRINISANGNNSGSITVKPASEMHPSIVDDTESGVQIVDKDNALQYYWTLKSEGITGFSATARMYYAEADVKVTSPYTIADYHTASLLTSGNGTWLKFPNTSFDETNKCLVFSFTGTDDAQISGDYTAGAGDATLDGAIPSHITVYETNSSGNWTTGSIWTPNVSGGPRGGSVKINTPHTVDVSTDYLSCYMAEINGTLNLAGTFGHRLGIVNGAGTIYMERGEMPAGVYANFFSPAGGTLHFGGADSYDILGNIPVVNNLTISGSGMKRLPNNNVTINGNLTITGASDLDVVNYYNRKISIKGDLTRTLGDFEAGTGVNATLALNGTLQQTISGSFIDNNAVNNLEISNSNNVTLDGQLEIDGELKLIEGMITVGPSGLLKINYGAGILPSAGTPLSFVNGILTKELMNGNSFTFPVGNYTSTKAHGAITLQNISGPAGINNWSASYFFSSPTLAGYNTSSYESSISTVSNTEYWNLDCPASGASVITINLDGSSDVASALDDLSNLRVVGWNGTRWEIVGTGAIVTGTKTSGTITTTTPVDYDIYSVITLASVIPVASGTATITTPAVVNICNGSTTRIIVNFTGETPYVLTYKEGGTTVYPPAINEPFYYIDANPSGPTVYTLETITANGVPGTITGTSSVTVNVNPKPVVNLTRSGSGAICEGTSITFTASPGLSQYVFRINSSTYESISNVYTTTLPVGTNSIDVTGTNAGGCSATSSALAVTVNPLPGAAGAITGAASVCRASAAQTYTVPVISDATSYLWSFSGAGASGSSNTNSINLTFPTAGTAIITVRGVNACGNGVPSTFNVSVNTLSTPGAAGVISGVSQVCRGGTGYTYSVAAVANATSYIWTYSGTGAEINGTGNSVTINFAGNATAGNLKVAGTNGCATGAYSPNFSIVPNEPPTASISPAVLSVCSSAPLTIMASPSGGLTPYTVHSWTGTGADYLSTTSSANTTFSSSAGGDYGLTYTVTDTRGCSGSVSTTVTVHQSPVANAGTDLTDLCSGTSPITMTGASALYSYTGTPVWTGTGGTWTQNPDPALATFTPSTQSGNTIATLTLTGANGCSNVTDSRNITWSRTPLQPGNFTVSSSSVCRGQTGVVYTVPNDPIVTTYNWTYTIGSGALISGTGNSITVNFSGTATSGSLNVTATNSCGTSTSRSILITVNIPQIAAFSYPGSPYCPSDADPLPALVGSAGTFSSTAGLIINATTGLIDLSASIPDTYTITNTIAATGGCGIIEATNAITIISDYVWTGAAGQDWNFASNWSCSTVPGIYSSIHIPDVLNKPILGSTGTVKNLTIDAGSSLTLDGGALQISGTITNSGLLDVSNGRIELNGTSPQIIPENVFLDNKINDLIIDNPSGVTLLGPLSVLGSLYLKNGDLVQGEDELLTLVSDATKTALIDGSGLGNVTGKVIMQRYLASRFGYKYISSPFSDATVNELAEEVDLSPGFPRIYAWDENRFYNGDPLEPYYAYTTLTKVFQPMAGYAVNFGAESSELTLNMTGSVNNGYYSATVTNHNNTLAEGRSLIGNPYPSPINWTSAQGWTKTNVDNALYYFKASTDDEWGGTYSSWNIVSSDGIASNIIPSMQGFMVHVTSVSPVDGFISMDNRVRVTNYTQPFIRKGLRSSTEKPLIRLSASFPAYSTNEDPLVVYFDENGTNNFDDKFDALKFMNTDYKVPNFFSFGNDGSRLSINALSMTDGHVPTIPLGFKSDLDGEVIFKLKSVEGPYSWGAINFFDSKTGEFIDLSSGSEYKVYLPAGEYFNRFFLNLDGFTTGESQWEPITTSFKVYSSKDLIIAEVNCITGKEGILTVNNFMGQTVFKTKVYENGRHEFDPGIMDGIYIVTFSTGNLRFSEKLIILNR